MPMSEIDLEKLRAGLMGDADLSKERAGSAFATRGAPEETSFAPKAFRVANKTFGEAELANADTAMEKLLQQYATEANFKDDIQTNLFQMDMKKKLQRLKMEMIRHAGETEKKMARAGLDAAKRQKVLQGIGGLSAAAAFAIATGVGGGSDSGPEGGINAPMTPDQAMGQGPLSSQQPSQLDSILKDTGGY